MRFGESNHISKRLSNNLASFEDGAVRPTEGHTLPHGKADNQGQGRPFCTASSPPTFMMVVLTAGGCGVGGSHSGVKRCSFLHHFQN